ncbi:transcription termination factor MTERF6, chloroplastic/mitochondrial-like [Magnolia sinica]|uniref:transcription termination factor MTERF6, chloroplastic/mitochondrial-like n=1 Tax=Magnolia sinica TaxID=86752 RepID=UPI00265A8042|nr:transcription termination factor MTERF6, chloroplastic/mitochondrial-like [Magnolia sinica]
MPVLQLSVFFFKNPCKTLFSNSLFKFTHLFPFSTSKSQNPSPQIPFIIDYLTNSCGFSPEKAISASKNLTHIKSPQNPDSVLSFFRNCGLNDPQIRDLISKRPQFLAANVQKTLIPKLKILQQIGLSGPHLSMTIVRNPVLLLRSVNNWFIPTVDFLRTVLGTDKNVATFFRRSTWDFPSGIKKQMQPNISNLQKIGVPIQRIVMLVLRKPTLFMQNPRCLEGTVARVEEMGLTHQDRMFIHALLTVGSLSKATLEAKFNLFKSFGWSEADTLSAFMRYPMFLAYSEERIQKMMHYYVTELGCDRAHIILRPKMLTYSLEKRIIPRCNVLRILESKDLLKKGRSLSTIIFLTEKKFLEEYVDPYKENGPDVYEAYMAQI